MPNPIAYVETPVADLPRAIAFYSEVFLLDIERAVIDGYEMGLLPIDPSASGCTGALVVGDIYVPAKVGPLIYMRVDAIDAVVTRATLRGSKVLLDRKPIGELGFVAEIEDSEGNRIGLHEVLP